MCGSSRVAFKNGGRGESEGSQALCSQGVFISISDFERERIEPVVFVTDRHPHSEHELGHKPPSSFQFVHHNEKM